MQDQIVRYIDVLKDRRRIFTEYLTECEKSANREDAIQYSGMIEAIDDIIAELGGFVKAQEHTELMRQALMEAYGSNEKAWIEDYENWEKGR